ncbi:unnamed protein product [Brassica oleracea]
MNDFLEFIGSLNLHTEEWRDLTLPLGTLGTSCQVANLENHLALAATYFSNHHWNVKIYMVHACTTRRSMERDLYHTFIPFRAPLRRRFPFMVLG